MGGKDTDTKKKHESNTNEKKNCLPLPTDPQSDTKARNDKNQKKQCRRAQTHQEKKKKRENDHTKGEQPPKKLLSLYLVPLKNCLFAPVEENTHITQREREKEEKSG